MSSTTTPKSNSYTTVQTRDSNIIAGIKKRLMNVPAIVIAGVSYTPATLQTLFQGQLDAVIAVLAATAQRTTAIAAYKAQVATINNAVTLLRDLVRQMFNNAPDALADFGFAPKKVTKRDPLTNVVAAAKNLATREARSTKSRKAKLAIKGVVTASDVAATVAAHLDPSAPQAGVTPPAGSGAAEPTPPSPAPGPTPLPVTANRKPAS